MMKLTILCRDRSYSWPSTTAKKVYITEILHDNQILNSRDQLCVTGNFWREI